MVIGLSDELEIFALLNFLFCDFIIEIFYRFHFKLKLHITVDLIIILTSIYFVSKVTRPQNK